MAANAMTRPNRIATPERILDACRTLELRGVKVTVDNVRNQIGGGCYGTICPLVKKYKTSSGTTPAERAQCMPQAKVARKNDADKKLSAVQEKLTKAEKRASDAESRLTELNKALQAMKAETSEAKQRAVVAELNLESATAQNARLTSQIAEQRTGAPLASAFSDLIGRQAA